ncbi:CRISPR-associated protein, Cse1 family [Lampropedia hyalina DSM 16112]|uniref:CRISPR-associated protein, Cse1 family n=1 Tax=Lampropedia hyalina DSM 16112 TaxID=1122156 RepID=A0A1M5DVK3_9BURK|nr:type I-E CRISPR-associated protein Cse1/CasA [Lampropedia hyalina]SHF70852.1 CRISPR-associated protein, Cse1 family [Lampropedia hyalina DSM 16112]
MSYTFNLLDEPWLPVRLANGQVVELGLLDVFTRSGEIVALAETAPPNLVAQYRLLLAIVHRALTLKFGQWKTKDRARWYRDGLPVAAIHAYLEQWRERFWLFHPQYPFMQVAALGTAEETRDKCKPWTQISLASASGNTPVVFDHSYDEKPTPIKPNQAIGALLGFLQFAPPGLIQILKTSDNAGALANTAAVIPIGQTLAQTLVLALHPASSRNAEHDLPAWEREPLTLAQLRGAPVLATGANDRYTRQSRAVLFLPDEDGSIRWLRFAAGWALGEDPNAPDPMASFRAGSDGPVRLTFRGGRALWRDLPALVPNPGKQSLPPAVLSHAIDLHQKISDDRIYQPLLVSGLTSRFGRPAVIERWRAEQISLPVSLLEDADRAAYLRIMVERAETLFKDMSGLAISMLAASMPEPNHKDTRSRARSVLEAGPLTSSYFTAAEQTLPEILLQLAEGHFEEADRCWNTALRRSARLTWERVTQGLGYSARALRADAKFLPRFYGLLNKQVPETHTAILEKETAE